MIDRLIYVVATEKLLAQLYKKYSLVKQREKKLITHRAEGSTSAKLARTKATVKADKRGTMMMVMATIFGLFVVLVSRVARVLNITAMPIISLSEKSRAEYVFPELPGIGPEIFFGKILVFFSCWLSE